MNELMQASYFGDVNRMRHILDNNEDIDINTQDTNGRNILMSYLQARIDSIDFITINEEINFINYLLYNRNININTQDTEGNTALIIAILVYDAESGSNQIIATLLRQTQLNINIENNDGINALMYASELGIIEVVDMLLPLGPNLNAIDNYGNTALTNAFEGGFTYIADRLIEVGADVNIGNYIILRNQEIMENTIIPFSSLLLNNENNIDINNDLVSEISKYLVHGPVLHGPDGKRSRSIKKKLRSSKKKKSRSSKKRSRTSKKRSRSIKKKKSRTSKKKY